MLQREAKFASERVNIDFGAHEKDNVCFRERQHLLQQEPMFVSERDIICYKERHYLLQRERQKEKEKTPDVS